MLRFGILSLLILTAALAFVFRWTLSPIQTEISFQDLAFDVSAPMPDRITNLNHRSVKIRGFIEPRSVFHETGIKQFLLVRDNQEPHVRDCEKVIVQLIDDETTKYVTRPIAVIGKFEILSPPLTHGGLKYYYRIRASQAESNRSLSSGEN